MQYDAVVFDNDGVLTTPTAEDVLERAMRDAFEHVGITDPTPAQIETLRGPSIDSLRTLAASCGVDSETLWTARENASIQAQFAEIRAGNKRLYDDVKAVYDLEQPRAIVSNNQQETIDNIVDHFGLDGFDPFLGRERAIAGIGRKKPNPYYLDTALTALEATNPVYVGDSHVDVVAAHTAGVDSVLLERTDQSTLEPEPEPTYRIESLAELPEIV